MQIDYETIVSRLKPYREKVFILPLEDDYLKRLENKIGTKFPELFFHFRKNIGFTQDFIPDIHQTEDMLIDDLEFTEEWCPGFFPIGTSEDLDYTWLIEKNSVDGRLYRISNDDEENPKTQKYKFTLKELMEQRLNSIPKEYPERLFNSKKARLFEIVIETNDFDLIIKVLSEKFKTSWLDKHWQKNFPIFNISSEVAEFQLEDYVLKVERDKYIMSGNMSYYFEIEEPLDKIVKQSIGDQIKELFDAKQIRYNFIDSGIFENDYDDE